MNPIRASLRRLLSILLRASIVLLAAGTTCQGQTQRTAVDFSRDIRPVLSDNCFRCHGPDENERSTDFRLDQRQSALSELDSGDFAIVPFDPDASELLRRITSDDTSQLMPPPHTGKKLMPREVDKLKQWIAEGASWNDHWSFITPTRPIRPPLENQRWSRNAIDDFVLARLEAARDHSVQPTMPAKEATRNELIRRVTFDLTGLPPTPREVDAFLADRAPNAYEQLVDRLVHSPRFGEHRARYWLDIARYGDTHGLHLDNERSVWPYRDWVIQSLNDNTPFDQFSIEQLAGDLLPNPSANQRVATGFHRCNVTTSEGGSIDEEYLARYAVDRVETTATTWLGLTAGCAACHDHKFDPVTQKEFYQLFAYFYSLSEKAMDGNVLLPPPSIRIPTVSQQSKLDRLLRTKADVELQIAALKQANHKQLNNWSARYLANNQPIPPPPNEYLRCSLDDQHGKQAVAWLQGERVIGNVVDSDRDGDDAAWDFARVNGGLRFDGKSHVDLGHIGDFEHDDAFSLAAWVYLDSDDQVTILSRTDDDLDLRGYGLFAEDAKLTVHFVSQWPSNALQVRSQHPLIKQRWHHVCATYDGSSKTSGVTLFVDGIAQETDTTHDSLDGEISNKQPLRIGMRSRNAPMVGMLDEVRIYRRAISQQEVNALTQNDPVADLIATPEETRTAQQQKQLFDVFLTRTNARYRKLIARHLDIERKVLRLQGQFSSSLIMEEMSQPRQAYILERGQYEKPTVPVSPGVPAAFPPLPDDAEPNRLALATWIMSPDNPLTARVVVNRIWQDYFGVGIVATSEDFGSQGEWPSHPQLLDWLAVEFVQSGWDLKHIHRLIVTSATYQQSAVAPQTLYKRDPDNRLLARGPRFRLDAEMIRDSALFTAGLLVERTGGKSVKPYQPPGLWEAVGYTSSNTAKFQRDRGEALYRRSMYTFWKRTSPPPGMQVFDAPSREVCTPRRTRTNTPTAALSLMNDVQYVEAARQLAVRILNDIPPIDAAADDEKRIRYGFQWTTTRQPTQAEIRVLATMLAEFREEFAADQAAAEQLINLGESEPNAATTPVELAAWTMVANTLLNLDESIVK